MTVLIKRGEYEVEIMADSFLRIPIELNATGYHRITSIRVRFARIVLAELNTHRMLSKNSASSRAIPAKKLRESVLQHPFIPNRFPKDHSGMQANEWVEEGSEEYELLKEIWLQARNAVLAIAYFLSQFKISKQLVNRLIEPFLMHEVIITATEWENFLSLRADPPAQNEIRLLAEMILEALNSSQPQELLPGEWHMPFGDKLDNSRIKELACKVEKSEDEVARMITTARCARVSYANFVGPDDYEKDLGLYKQLSDSGHWSPFEHVARAMTNEEYLQYSHSYPDYDELGCCGNFRGFIQLRRTFPRSVENRSDSRLHSVKL